MTFIVFLLNTSEEKKESIMDELLSTPVFESCDSDACIGYITHVTREGSNINLFYAIDSRKCTDREYLGMAYRRSVTKTITKLFVMYNSPSKIQCLGDLFDNAQTFILNREIGE